MGGGGGLWGRLGRGPHPHQRGCCVAGETHSASRVSGLLMLWISDTISVGQGTRRLRCPQGSQTSSLESQPLPPRQAPTVISSRCTPRAFPHHPFSDAHTSYSHIPARMHAHFHAWIQGTCRHLLSHTDPRGHGGPRIHTIPCVDPQGREHSIRRHTPTRPTPGRLIPSHAVTSLHCPPFLILPP